VKNTTNQELVEMAEEAMVNPSSTYVLRFVVDGYKVKLHLFDEMIFSPSGSGAPPEGKIEPMNSFARRVREIGRCSLWAKSDPNFS